MSGFHQVLIGGYPDGGLMTDRKPLMLPNQAFSNLQNAYVWRERVLKRIGSAGVGQLQRVFSATSIGSSPASATWTFTLFSIVSPAIAETYASLAIGSVIITVGGDTFTDQGNGTLRRQDGNLASTINYITSSITLIRTSALAAAATATFGYYPGLQVMGIIKQDTASVNIDQTIFFDTKYAYQFITGAFQQLGTATWTAPNLANGTNTNFFWGANYQGATPDLKYFFTTNYNITQGFTTPYDPIRYYSSSWNDLQPLVTATITLYQGLIIVPYYGRLLILNTWEGLTGNPANATNFYSRCRFSQIGDPIAVDAWRSDIFGKGGFLDAPTNESIVSAAFFRNTLLVFFEYSTWQLRYIGEYGIPFIFERVSSDFGSSCTNSPIIFDQGVMTVSDRGIIQASANGVTRLDDQIPETAFGFEIQDNAQNFVHGVRDFEKEVVYWNYLDTSDNATTQVFPNTTLLFNYRNNTWAQFRDSITCFGKAQFQFGITWDTLLVTWENPVVTWDNVDDQNYVEYVVAGNQQGFISIYENLEATGLEEQITNYAPSLFIYSINTGASPTEFTVPNHNLENSELIYITDALWSGTDPGINNAIYEVTVIDQNTITLSVWDGDNYADFTVGAAGTYIGGGLIALLPVMNIVGKDFNPFQGQGKQFKLSYIDFQLDADQQFPSIPAVTVQLYVNSNLGEQANVITGNQELLNSSQPSGIISHVLLTNPCQVQSIDHSLQNGAVISIANIVGTTELNNGIYAIAVVDKDNFTLTGIDATGFTPYISGGIWNVSPSEGQVYIPGVQYAWYRFYSTQYGQYLRIALTYDDALMNQLATHQTPLQLNAMMLYMKEGGRIIN